MGARNVHKDDVTIFKLPHDAIQEDRGLSTCNVPQKVLASTADVVPYKNDRTAIAYKFDSMTIQLEDSNGSLTSAAGVSVSFPYQPDAVGFVIDWRQVTDGGGQLIQGCYRVRVNWTLAGNSGWFYHGAYQLLEYSVDNAKGTTRLYVVLNDLVRKQGINYKDSGFAGTVRFDGIFGFMQPNYQTENNIHTNRERFKVRNEALRTYELRTSYLNRCATRLIDEDTLLAANQIYVTDHNAANHDRYYDFPVILSEEESPSFEYPIGSVFAKITAKFLDKVAYHESKYDGNIAGSENVILTLPTIVSSCPPAVSCTGTSGTYSTGQTTTYGTNDDQNLNTNFWTLPTGKLNKWNHNWRWCGITGGYTDGTSYFDVNGVSTTRALAFPDGLICNLGSVDCDDNFQMWHDNLTLTGNTTWDLARAACNSYSVGSFTTGWRMCTKPEGETLFYQPSTYILDQKPFEAIFGIIFWTGTVKSSNDLQAYRIMNTLDTQSGIRATNAGRAFPVRVTNLSEIP